MEPHQCNCRQLLFWTHSYWNLPDHRLHVMWNTATTGSMRKGKFTITTHWHRCPAWRRQERPSVQRLQEWSRQQLERSNKSYFLGLHNHTITGYIIAPSIVSPKGGYQGAPTLFLTWFPLMWSLECLICFDVMEKLSLPPPPPPPSFCTWGKHCPSKVSFWGDQAIPLHLRVSPRGTVSMGTVFRSKGCSFGWLQYWRRALSSPTTETLRAGQERIGKVLQHINFELLVHPIHA